MSWGEQAQEWYNEQQTAQAYLSIQVPRQQVFLVSKLHPRHHGYDSALRQLNQVRQLVLKFCHGAAVIEQAAVRRGSYAACDTNFGQMNADIEHLSDGAPGYALITLPRLLGHLVRGYKP